MSKHDQTKVGKFLSDSMGRGGVMEIILTDEVMAVSTTTKGLHIVEASSPKEAAEYYRSDRFIAHYHGFGTGGGGIRSLRFDLPNNQLEDIMIYEHQIKKIEVFKRGETYNFRTEE